MATEPSDGRKPSLAKLLKYGADPNALSFEDPGQKRTLLCLSIEEAVKIDDLSRVDLLLDARADPCKASETGDYPLQLSVKHKRLDLARTLLRRKADVNQQDEKLVTPLHHATHKADTHVLQLLLMHRANVNAADRVGQTPLFFAKDRPTIASLMDSRADMLHLNNKGQSALHLACHSGNYDAVAFLSDTEEMAPFIDLQDEHGRTPLHHAAFRGHQDVVSRLMDVGANPKITTFKGQTAMSLADAKEHLDVAYYIYTRVSGGNKSSWSESMQNPVFLTTAAIMGVALFVNRTLLWEFTIDVWSLLRH